MKFLVVAAHPDDEVLGCGGTIARLSRAGHDIHILILGEGITSRYGRREDADASLMEDLRARSRQAAELLGAGDVSFHQFPDNRFDSVPLLDLVKHIEAKINDYSPEVIFTHHSGDLNIDHCLVHRAVLTATRPQLDHPVREIYAFEIPSSTEWAFLRANVFFPNVFYDITDTMETKIQALSRYSSELREFPHPRSLEAIKINARHWGSVAGGEAMEAFQLVRAIYRS